MIGTIDAKTKEIVDSLYGPEPVATSQATAIAAPAPVTLPMAVRQCRVV